MAFVLAVATGCGASSAGSGEHPCTLMASPEGISIRIAPEIAKQVSDTTRVRACWAGSCHMREVRLRPDTKTKDLGCSAGVCSGKMLPAPGKGGFANLPKLPAELVRVTLTLTGSGGEPVVAETLRVVPQPTYPNGPDCGKGGPQAGLRVTSTGDVREM